MTYRKLKGWRLLVDNAGTLHVYNHLRPHEVFKLDEFILKVENNDPRIDASRSYHGGEGHRHPEWGNTRNLRR